MNSSPLAVLISPTRKSAYTARLASCSRSSPSLTVSTCGSAGGRLRQLHLGRDALLVAHLQQAAWGLLKASSMVAAATSICLTSLRS